MYYGGRMKTFKPGDKVLFKVGATRFGDATVTREVPPKADGRRRYELQANGGLPFIRTADSLTPKD